FIPTILEKLRQARQMIDNSGLSIRLEIDGGVTKDNIGDIAMAGADTFVAGSAIFKSADYDGTISDMRRAIDQANVAEKSI
ncbi:MAG: ribulose-phosphate 3-epimerase, partial [Pseudomonadota bacterium]|nr:ribulose-phosphate 3-epimerase [Pseudomonadota bacterium]